MATIVLTNQRRKAVTQGLDVIIACAVAIMKEETDEEVTGSLHTILTTADFLKQKLEK
jgi:hypothetical protein